METEPPAGLHTRIPHSSGELSYPHLECKIQEYRAETPPSPSDLLQLTSVKTSLARRGFQPILPASVACFGPVALRRNTSVASTIETGFRRWGLLPTEISSVQPLKHDSELESPLMFSFPSHLEIPADVCFLAGGVEFPEDDQVAIFASSPDNPATEYKEPLEPPQYPMAGLLPLAVQLIAPPTAEPPGRFAAFAMASGALVLPINNPVPLRPKVAETAPGRVSRPLKYAGVAVEEPVAAEPGSPTEPDIDIPPFLRAAENDALEKSRWGSVQKYLKNIVGCLLVAGVLGPFASRTVDRSSWESGETDRVRCGLRVRVLAVDPGVRLND